MRIRSAVAAMSVAAVCAPASAAATTLSVQIRGDVVAGVPVEGDLVVAGAPPGAQVAMILHPGATDCFRAGGARRGARSSGTSCPVA